MLISLAVDYRHADVATRERFHLTPERVAALYGADALDGASRPRRAVPAVVALATCNRSEVYAWRPDAALGAAALDSAVHALARRWMGAASGARQLLDVARRRTGDAAARHLFRVASGIESQVLGDAQLLGQLREAHQRAARSGAAGTMLHRLFESALHVGKRARAETGLSSGRYSVGAEAANMAARRFGSLARARVVVIGCGKTGERVSRQLAKLGATDVVVVNRTYERAQALAVTVRGRAAPIEALYGELALADIAIVATSATTPIVFADPLVRARRHCQTMQYPLLFFDLSVPRNVDPTVASVPGVVVVDLDALRPAVAAAERDRLSSVPLAEVILEEELDAFLDWMRAGTAREAIRPLYAALTDVCMREVEYAAGEEIARRTAPRIAAKLLARPMLELRGRALRGESLEQMTDLLSRLFAVDAAPPGRTPPPREARPGARADLTLPVPARAAPLQETA